MDEVVACEKATTGASSKSANASKENEFRIVLFIGYSVSYNRKVCKSGSVSGRNDAAPQAASPASSV
jgi:hypothetical protein